MPGAPTSKRLPTHISKAALRRLKRGWNRITRWPPVGSVEFGELRRVTPVSAEFGLDRGQPIDRYYVERFLEQHAADIRGRVLEIGDDRYTRQFGGTRVSRSDVLHMKGENPAATIVADLADAGIIAADSFDCIIVTQTLQFIYDIRAAVSHLHRMLALRGTIL